MAWNMSEMIEVEAADKMLDRLQEKYGPPREWQFSPAPNNRITIKKYPKAYEAYLGAGGFVCTCRSTIELFERLATWFPKLVETLAEPIE
jgi:hypothetical protein